MGARGKHGRRSVASRRSIVGTEAVEEDEEAIDPDAPACIPALASAWGGEDGHEQGSARECSNGPGSDSEASSGESDASYEAYDLDDDRSDLRSVPRPRHLRQLLSGLRAKEGEHELVDAALESAAPLIRAAADNPELDALAPPLCRALLHLADTYRLPRFSERRHAGLLALAVRSPRRAAQLLTTEFYSEHVSLEMRMSVLRTIHAMADELATPTTAREPSSAAAASSVAASALSASYACPTAPNGIASIASRCPSGGRGSAAEPSTRADGARREAKTRRWGSSSLRSRPAASASLLGAVAPLFFFPLMARYDDPANTFRLLTEDCFLLEVSHLPSPLSLSHTHHHSHPHPLLRPHPYPHDDPGAAALPLRSTARCCELPVCAWHEQSPLRARMGPSPPRRGSGAARRPRGAMRHRPRDAPRHHCRRL